MKKFPLSFFDVMQQAEIMRQLHAKPVLSAKPFHPKQNVAASNSCNPAAFYGLAEQPVPEYKFHPERRWRFDYAWPMRMVALEVDGGLFINGGHSRGAARERDYEKDAEAACLGWRVIRCSPRQFKDGTVNRWLKRLILPSL